MHFGAIFSAVLESLGIDFFKVLLKENKIKGQKRWKILFFLKIEQDKYQMKLCFAL